MISSEVQVSVTRHAVERWCQRFAAYGDENATHVEEALRQSEEIGPDIPLPGRLRRDPRRTYFLHPRGAIFLCDRMSGNRLAILTILTEDMVDYEPPAPRSRPEPTLEERLESAVSAEELLEIERPASFRNINEFRNWLVDLKQRLEKNRNRLCGYWSKETVRLAGIKLDRELGEIKDEWLVWKNSRAFHERLEKEWGK